MWHGLPKQRISMQLVPSASHGVGGGAKTPAASIVPHPRLGEKEEGLCIFRNVSKESFSICVAANTPGGSSFILEQEADLEPGGHSSFVARAIDNVVVRTPFAYFVLANVEGRPALQPGDGLHQEARWDGVRLLNAPHCVLICAAWSTAHQPSSFRQAPRLTIEQLLAELPACASYWELWRARAPELPPECTILAASDSFEQEHLTARVATQSLEHFIMPTALFVREGGRGEAQALDGTRICFRGDPTHVFVELKEYGEWPSLTLVGNRRPERVADPWIICYVLRLIL